MIKFKHDFREVAAIEIDGDTIYNLPNGEKSYIYELSDGEEKVTLLVTGSGCGDTIFSLSYRGDTRIKVLPGFDEVHVITADLIADYLDEYKKFLSKGFYWIVQNFRMV